MTERRRLDPSHWQALRAQAERVGRGAGSLGPELLHEVRGVLDRLLVVAEQYPNLKANQGFRDLQTQLEGTENRITVARNRYIKSVQEYNITVRSFPNNLTAMVMGYAVKPSFTVENEAAISKPPTVDFGTK